MIIFHDLACACHSVNSFTTLPTPFTTLPTLFTTLPTSLSTPPPCQPHLPPCQFPLPPYQLLHHPANPISHPANHPVNSSITQVKKRDVTTQGKVMAGWKKQMQQQQQPPKQQQQIGFVGDVVGVQQAVYAEECLKMKKEESARAIILGFMGMTTLHGPAHMVRHLGTWPGYLWGVITFTFWIGLSWNCAIEYQNFFSREIHTQSSTGQVGARGLQLPSFVICNRGFFSKAKIEALGMESSTVTYLIGLSINPSLVNTKILSTSMGHDFIRSEDIKLHQVMEKHNFNNISSLITAMSYSCEDLVLKCAHGIVSTDGNKCCQSLKPVATTSGLCFAMLPDKNFYQNLAGEYKGYILFLSLPQDDVPGNNIFPDIDGELIDKTFVAKTDIQLTVMNNLTYPSLLVTGQGSLITKDSLNSIRVTLSEIDKSGMKTAIDINLPECSRPENLDPTRPTTRLLSTVTNCLDGALVKCFYKMCQCFIYGFSYSFKDHEKMQMCSLNKTVQCITNLYEQLSEMSDLDTFTEFSPFPNLTLATMARKCLGTELRKCQHLCHELRYSYTNSMSPMRPAYKDEVSQDLIQDTNYRNSSLALVTVYYSSNLYTKVKIYRLAFGHLMSNLGGHMGLFLGCSIITAMEFFLIILYLTRHVLRYLGRCIFSRSHSDRVTPITLKPSS
ncbi:hypothetical protein Pmani_035522 [Petrolisthes manimaculis]|uniref:Uncharacterized protein n=1 Tax=Petrolisthes manimaculis TaxID=1843537 RepID=A0AAE1TQG1_9EUCA|nr:hypothetical protein Pmani_035522 [Petrolisthes manimaculis]